MTRSRPHLRPCLVALAAIAGMMSTAGASSACEAKAARSCCASRAASDCGGCCGPSEAAPIRAAGAETVAPNAEDGIVAAPRRPCECRSGEPVAPTPKPESRPARARIDLDRDADDFSSREARLTVKHAPLASRFGGPPTPPVYLRTSRLLI